MRTRSHTRACSLSLFHTHTHTHTHTRSCMCKHARAHTPKVIHYCGSCGNAMKSCYMPFSFFSLSPAHAHTHTHTHTDACEGTDRGLCLSSSLCTFTQYHILNAPRSVSSAKRREERKPYQFENSTANSGAAASAWFSRPISPLLAQTSVRTASKSGSLLTLVIIVQRRIILLRRLPAGLSPDSG